MPVEEKPAFFQELRRRNVIRVGIAYVLVAWILLQIADVLFPALGLPKHSYRPPTHRPRRGDPVT